MRDYNINEIKAICDGAMRHMGVPFIDDRLTEYGKLYNGNHRYYSVLRGISAFLQPTFVVEIGGWQGTSAACFAAGYAGSTVITIDHHSDPGDDINQVKMMEAKAVFPNIEYFHGCSTPEVTALKQGTRCVLPDIQEFLQGRSIDILFIDGWHDGQLARYDFDHYAPRLSKDALVICDDITGGDSSGHIGMFKFWEDLPGKEKYLDGDIHPGYPMGFLKMGAL